MWFFYLTEAKVDTGSLTDVHDLPVRGQHEDEPVQRLEEVRAQLLHHLVSAQGRLHTPALTKTFREIKNLYLRILTT